MDIIVWLAIGLGTINLVCGLAFYVAIKFRRRRKLKYRLLKYKQLGGGATAEDMLWLKRNPDADREFKVQFKNRIKWIKNWFIQQYTEFVDEVKKKEFVERFVRLGSEELKQTFPEVEETRCEQSNFRNLACDLREPDGISETLTDEKFFGEPIKTETKVNKKTGKKYEVLVLDKETVTAQ